MIPETPPDIVMLSSDEEDLKDLSGEVEHSPLSSPRGPSLTPSQGSKTRRHSGFNPSKIAALSPRKFDEPTFIDFPDVENHTHSLSRPHQRRRSSSSSDLFVRNPDSTPITSPSTTASPLPIPATVHTPPYSCALLDSLFENGPIQPHNLSHLPCSFLSDPTLPPPTLLELKKHTQALCLLLSTLQNCDLESPNINGIKDNTLPCPLGTPSFDFLNDLYTPYTNTSPSHNIALTSLRNTTSPPPPPREPDPKPPECAILASTAAANSDSIRTTTLTSHANTILTHLSTHLSPTGGLLSLLSPSTSTNPPTGLLPQWLHYTQSLLTRLSALERDIVLLREILASEKLVPDLRLNFPTGSESRNITQDRYVLAGLSEGLWARLNRELDISEEMGREERVVEGVERLGRGWGRGDEVGNILGAEGGGVCWVEVRSRICRVQNREEVFIFPGWDLHEGGEAVRRVEEGCVVQTVYRGGEEGSETERLGEVVGQSGEEVRNSKEQVRRLGEENEVLKRELTVE